ncbi:hypothetical protein FRY74_12570 [Vicingus serpentipes]|uniref:Sulfotransferase family protein n=1 Tax=Vicingus serpentipes TaxID=1926625 RepID=A0A5C6RMR8_9FLAO|nr:sulfotransferase [Vicingus serpentipes]TXB63698.1 hypothetical protein FRY74_12570 [Vicingus serpentipes]
MTLPFFKNKIFCISYQRTGTTSTGQFFKDHGYKVATWGISNSNKWSLSWLKGDYEKIFKSFHFKKHQVFEDGPWWCNDFYKVLFHRFPKSKFILLERNPDKWFDSMLSHSNGKTLGNTHLHSILYNRELDFHNLGKKLAYYSGEIDNLLPLQEKHREHYKNIYITRINEIKMFFEIHNPDRLFFGSLEDKQVWNKIGVFFNIPVKENYNSHANKTKSK